MGRPSIRSSVATLAASLCAFSGQMVSAIAAQSQLPPHLHDDALLPCSACSEGKIELHRFMRQMDPASVLTPASVLNDRGPVNTPRGTTGDDPALVGNTDVLDYDLTLDINPTTRVLTGSNLITIRALAAGVSFVDLELHQNFTLGVVQVNGVNATTSRPNASIPKILRVNIPAGAGAIAANQTFTIRVDYSGVPVSGGFGSIVFTTQNSQPVVSTLSQTRFAHTWWPVKENNADKATGTMRISVPNPLSVASNGVLQSETAISGNRTQFTYRTNYRTPPYLFAISATQYGRFNETWNYTPQPGSPFGSGPVSMPLQYMIYSGNDTTTNRNAMRNVSQMLTTLSNVYGLYPFYQEKYGLYQFAFSGGMEHQTMSGQGGSNPWSQSLSAHELGHQWWGDLVTCTTWADIWLNEGLATYSEALWVENRPSSFGVNGYSGLLIAMNNRRPSNTSGTVYVYDINNENLIFSFNNSYLKGAWVFHMLRRVMGDANFFAALQAYRQQYNFKTADTQQFRAVCESFHGSSLETFFEQWVMMPGVPVYSWATQEVTVPAAGGGVQRFAEIYLQQTQASPAAEAFVMPVEFNASINGATQILKVQNSKRQQHFLVPIADVLGPVNLDPDNWILSGTRTAVSMPASGPRVVATTPASGSSSVVGSISSVTAQFHQPMNAGSVISAVSVTRGGQSVSNLTASYDAGLQRVNLVAAEPLMPGSYTLTIGGAASGVNGLAIDGEGSTLPSGDGVAGGAFVMNFTIAACSAADVGRSGGGEGGDGVLDNNDFIVFINLFFAGDVRADAGIEGGAAGSDGIFDNNDFIVFIDAFFAGGC